MNPHYLSDPDYFSIYSKVPRLNIDLVIRSQEGILLALRTIEPHAGAWHLPGGMIYKDESIADAAARIAQKETGLNINLEKSLGYMEFPHEMRSGVDIHTISIAIQATPVGGTLKHDENAEELRYFKELPEAIIPQHKTLLQGLL